MSLALTITKYPELIVGIAGPIGIDIDEIDRALKGALKAVGYDSATIRITDEIKDEETDCPAPRSPDFYKQMCYKMDHASAVCRKYRSPDTLMKFAMQSIRQHRAHAYAKLNKIPKVNDNYTPISGEKIRPQFAYIIRQLKRPEEVSLLRRTYGKQFILVSAYGSHENRKRIIETKIRRSAPIDMKDHEISSQAERLIFRDANEDSDDFGQHLRDTFHLADVFIDGIAKPSMESMTKRFINAFFGKNDIAPSKPEYGMYAAKSASLRSSDLSRQVGSAIFTDNGELITQGCNEVPKAFGGTYWDGEEPDFRDVKLGHDPNDILKKEVVRDLLERMLKADLLSETAKNLGNSSEMVDALIKKPEIGPLAKGHGALSGSAITDLTEYGRVVHAEMCAICDAARLGRSLKGLTLYCTTFPCHNCTKHILASGISKVIYMEPYPKSKAKELHENEIEIERESKDRVSFIPFLGISPQRYRDIFQKGKRKQDGIAVPWLSLEPKPMIEATPPAYLELEAFEISALYGSIQPVPQPSIAPKKRKISANK